jgi:DNA-binding NarL/FixJ family response regulator
MVVFYRLMHEHRQIHTISNLSAQTATTFRNLVGKTPDRETRDHQNNRVDLTQSLEEYVSIERHSKPPAIPSHTFDNDDISFRAIQNCANGFIRKDSTLVELTSYLDKVIAGERVFRLSVTRSTRSTLDAFQPAFETWNSRSPHEEGILGACIDGSGIK